MKKLDNGLILMSADILMEFGFVLNADHRLRLDMRKIVHLERLMSECKDGHEFIDCPKAIGKPQWCECHGFQYGEERMENKWTIHAIYDEDGFPQVIIQRYGKKEYLSTEQAEVMLNAAEKLSAEDANRAARLLGKLSYNWDGLAQSEKALSAYAQARGE